MQRYSWEHGIAMQGMLEIGDTSKLIIMARESLQRKKPDGRLSMVGSDMNIADPGVNGPAILAAYKITGDEKYKIADKFIKKTIYNKRNKKLFNLAPFDSYVFC